MAKRIQRLELSDEEQSSLRWLARQLGLFDNTETGSGEGSIFRLILKLARGNLACFLVADPCDQSYQIDRLAQLADENPEVADLLRQVTAALERTELTARSYQKKR